VRAGQVVQVGDARVRVLVDPAAAPTASIE